MSKDIYQPRKTRNTRKFFLFFSVYSVCSVVVTNASELVRFPDMATAWDVQVTPSKFIASGSNPPRTGMQLAAITVMQDGNKRCYRATYSNDKVRETWEIPQYALFMVETPGGNITKAGVSADLMPFCPVAFKWLQTSFRKNQKPENYAGKLCWRYEGTRNLYNDDGEVICVLKCAAWIEAESLLPVALDDGVNYGIFKFREETALKMPDKFKEEMSSYLLLNGLPPMKE